MGVAPEPAHRSATDTSSIAPPAPQVEPEGPAAPVPLGALVVGHAEDRAEADADRRADVALGRLRRLSGDAGTDGAAAEQHQHGPGCDHVRRSPGAAPGAVVGREGGALDGDLSTRISSRRGSGSALPEGVRGRMESAFGTSMASVRIHTDDNAAQLSRQISARAFTTGNDVFFGKGEFAPDTPEGERVLAHELAHTQQPAEAVHRWPWDSKEEKAEKAQLAQAKKVEKDEKNANTQLAKTNSAIRSKDKDKVSKEITEMQEKQSKQPVQDPSKGPVTFTKSGQGAHLDDLNSRFQAKLAHELWVRNHRLTQLVYTYLKDPQNKAATREQAEEACAEEAEVYAFEIVWVEQAEEDLKAYTPTRATASERLARAVRTTRSEENGQVKRGELLTPDLERVYEAWEVKTIELMAGPPMKVRDEADAEAGSIVWGLAGKDLAGKRPEAPLERLARKNARTRTNTGMIQSSDVKAFLAQGQQTSTLDTAAGLGQTIGGIAEPIIGGIDGVGKIVGAAGKDQDKGLQSGITKSMEYSEGAKVPVAGDFVKSVENVQHAKATNTSDISKFVGKDKDGKSLPTSTTTKAADGMGTVTSVLGDLIKGANNTMKMVQAIRDALAEKSAAKIAAATKACADAGGSIGTLGKDTANLAKLIDPGVTNSVASVIPGFNIAIAVMSLVSNSVDLATSSVTLSNSNDSLTAARLRTGKKVDVMVAPLLHTTAAATKKVEQAAWATGQSVSSLITSIATVATAGGFGIPAAVDAGMKLLDLLHKVGHFIADNVLAVLAQRSREASVAALEGAAEGQFRADPAMAVDGILMRARKNDEIALKFLAAYGLTKADVKEAPLAEVREKVLAQLGEDADPKTVYQSYKSKIGGMMDKWKDTGGLAEKRNAEDGKGRSIFWRIQMTLRSDEKHKRSVNKTTKLQGYVECRVGGLTLYADATTAEKEKFVADLEKVDLLTIDAASRDTKNSVEWQRRLSEIHHEVLAKGIKNAPGPQPVPLP